ncbi:MAG: HPr family phosphocarrier protein [Aridibacter sp.]|jgi:phosphotransferase system HPr (HPr) family protein|nr:HPr family phosphocarrier protein [Acidobacteriota bacterium]
MVKANVKVINQLGLHARAAAQLVRLAGEFDSNIKLIKKDKSVFADAKSILNILTLAASKGTELIVEIKGTDEKEAMKAIKNLFSEGFGEL